MTTAQKGGEGSASRFCRSLAQGKTQYPLYRRLGGPQGRSGQVRKISLPTGICSPDHRAGSQSLDRLSYPAHTCWKQSDNNNAICIIICNRLKIHCQDRGNRLLRKVVSCLSPILPCTIPHTIVIFSNTWKVHQDTP